MDDRDARRHAANRSAASRTWASRRCGCSRSEPSTAPATHRPAARRSSAVGPVRSPPPEDRVLAVGRHRIETAGVGLPYPLSGCELADSAAQEPAQPRHSRVGRSAVLQGMDGDGPLRDLRLVVARLALALLVGPLVFGLADEVDRLPADQRRIVLAPRVQPGSEEPPADGAGGGVVHRHHPAQHGATLERLRRLRLLPDGSGLVRIGQDGVHGADPDVLAHLPGLDVHHAERGVLVLDHLVDAGCGAELDSARSGVQVQHVDRVLGVLVDLEPVAGRGDGERLAGGVRHPLAVEHGKRRAILGRSEIGEQQVVVLVHGIGPLHHVAADGAVGGLGAGPQDGPVDVVVPAVVAADDAPFGDDPVLQRRAPVRAVAMEEPRPSGSVAEQHQVFAEDPHHHGEVRELFRHRDRLPVAAEILAAGGAGSDVGELGILPGVPDPVIALEAFGAQWFVHDFFPWNRALMAGTAGIRPASPFESFDIVHIETRRADIRPTRRPARRSESTTADGARAVKTVRRRTPHRHTLLISRRQEGYHDPRCRPDRAPAATAADPLGPDPIESRRTPGTRAAGDLPRRPPRNEFVRLLRRRAETCPHPPRTPR